MITTSFILQKSKYTQFKEMCIHLNVRYNVFECFDTLHITMYYDSDISSEINRRMNFINISTNEKVTKLTFTQRVLNHIKYYLKKGNQMRTRKYLRHTDYVSITTYKCGHQVQTITLYKLKNKKSNELCPTCFLRLLLKE